MTTPGATNRWRALLGVAGFWVASLSVGLAAFVVLAALAHFGNADGGQLGAASAVISLSFVYAVVPGAIQLRAAADAAARRGSGPALPRAFVRWSTGVLLLAAPALATLLTVPALAVVALAGQYAAACVASAQRGAAIGTGDQRAASVSMAVEAGVRIVAGVGLGIAFGAVGLGAALLLGSVSAALVGARATGVGRLRDAAARPVLAPALGVGLLMLLVNLDAFTAPRVLGASAADAYAVAELPARGVFFALFAVSWLAVPLATAASRRGQLLAPVGGVLALGAAAGLTLLTVRPLLPIALGDPAPAAGLLATLVAAMTLAAMLATVLAMAVARDAALPWLPTLLATLALAAVVGTTAPAPEQLAGAVLAATAAALAGTLVLLLRTAAVRSARPAPPAVLARR